MRPSAHHGRTAGTIVGVMSGLQSCDLVHTMGVQQVQLWCDACIAVMRPGVHQGCTSYDLDMLVLGEYASGVVLPQSQVVGGG
jgi:hypothetical protein